ncbi:2-phospho-L-lactate transferase, partial [archaeon SCG-AAA382B04]
FLNHSEKEIEKIEFEGIKKASPSREFIKTIEKEKTIIIGPSNPITSIKPIIDLNDIKRKLKDRRVIAISPFLGEKVFSGPAARLMKKTGYKPSSQGVTEVYKDFLDKIVVDKKDPNPPTKSVKADIVMKDKQDEIKLARTIKKELS